MKASETPTTTKCLVVQKSLFYFNMELIPIFFFFYLWLYYNPGFSSLYTLGMDTLNNAIESLMTSLSREDWMPVTMNVADATVTVINETVRQKYFV